MAIYAAEAVAQLSDASNRTRSQQCFYQTVRDEISPLCLKRAVPGGLTNMDKSGSPDIVNVPRVVPEAKAIRLTNQPPEGQYGVIKAKR